MAILSAFIFTTLNGYTHSKDGDISWHVHGEEENEYASRNLDAGNALVFGRKTYELMASYWPTPMAQENDPGIAPKMNSAQKWVCSNSLTETHWENTNILSGDIFRRIQELKDTSDRNLTLLGSNNLVTQLAERGLINELQLMIDPVSIGNGVPLFSGMKHLISFAPKQVRALKSGVVLISYQYQH